jgi:hypothetical protein
MEIGNVTAEKIHFSRQSRATDAEIKALAEDIRDNGLHHPILVNAHSGTVLDGLNRLLAFRMLGWSVVPALFCETPSEAADVLADLRKGEQFGYRRIMELFRDFKELSHEWDMKRRLGHKRGTKIVPMEGARIACGRACGVSENAINRINMLVNLAEDGNVQAQEVVTAMFASPPGSPIMGYERVLKMSDAERRSTPMEEKERVEALTNVIRAAETALDQAFRIGGMHTLSSPGREVVDERIKSLTKMVRNLNRAVKGRF